MLTDYHLTKDIGKKMQVKINVNDYVKVKLNKKGFEIHRKDYDHLWVGRIPPYEYKAPEVDCYGYSKFPLWELMQTFGQYLRIGELIPFDSEIVFEKG